MNSNPNSIFTNKEFNPVILQTIIQRYWWWFLGIVSAFLILAFLYLRYTKPIYESTTVVQIGEKDQGKELIELENINSKTDVSTELELLRSELIISKALAKLNMNVSVFAEGNILTEERYKMGSFSILPFSIKDSSLCNVPIYLSSAGNRVKLNYMHQNKPFEVYIPFNKKTKLKHFELLISIHNKTNFEEETTSNKLYFILNTGQSLLQRHISNISINVVDPNAKTISINYRGYSPVLCQDMVSSISKAFFEYDEKNKRSGASNILDFIDIQLDSISGELQNSKDSLSRFSKISKYSDPQDGGVISSNSQDALQEELFGIEEEIYLLKSIQGKLRNEPNRLDIYRTIPEMLGKSFEGSLSSQISDLNSLLERKEEMLPSANENNSEVKAINQRIQTKVTFVRRSIDLIKNRLDDNAKILRSRLGVIEGEMLSRPSKKMEYDRLKSTQTINQKFYDLLMEKKVLYSISNAGYISNNRVLSSATKEETPVSPNRKMIYFVFAFLGVVIGIIVLLFKYLTFNEINTLQDLESLLPPKVSILGSIPLIKNSNEFSQLIVHESPKSMLAESMRNIRSNLSFIKEDIKTIAISSSISGEGKTFVALNLAGIIALSDKKTLIIDLDLRKPKVHLGLGLTNDFGMSNLIIGQHQLDECIRKTPIPNLDFISAGPVPPNPSELILNERFNQLLEEMKLRYDVVVIDNPPVGLVTDGVKILADADVPIYIFKSGYSKRVFVRRTADLVNLNQIKNLNVIMNGAKVGNSAYGYGYGYGYGYYEEDTKTKKKKQK